jgi:p-hydroxybenzoic acid efflux pump subunit AaeB
LSLTLITQACETYLIQNTRPELITDTFRELFDEPVETVQDVHRQMKRMRRVIAWTGERETPVTIYSWVGAATRYLLLKRGVVSNTKISATEEEVLRGEVVIKPASAERHHAMVNFWRTTILRIRNLILVVERLDFRQWNHGDDRGGDVAGNASAKSENGGH